METSSESDYCVKGSVLQSKLDALDSLFGRRAVVSLQTRLRRRLTRQVNLLEWYPYDILEEVLEDMRANAFGGRVSAMRDTASVTSL